MHTSRESDLPKKPPAHLLTEKLAEDQLQPYKTLLEECIQKGWDAWDLDYKHKRHILSPRSRSSIVFDEIVFRAQEKFSGLAGVTVTRKRNTFLLYIGDHIIIRFKKIGKNGKCSSIATHQQMLFKLQIELPGMEKGTMLNAGYTLDDMQTQIISKRIVCQFSNSVLWTIDLVGSEGKSVETMPSTPAPRTPADGPRFVAKKELESTKRKAKKSNQKE